MDVGALLRAIPLGLTKNPREEDLSYSNLWRLHLSDSLVGDNSTEVEELSRRWKLISRDKQMHIWKSWTKPSILLSNPCNWDLEHTTFSRSFWGSLYFREDEIDMSTNVDTITRTEMWLSVDGLHVTKQVTSWMSTSACCVM